MRPSPVPFSARETAAVIDRIAGRVERQRLSLAVQSEIQDVSRRLLARRHMEGLKLLNRIGMLQALHDQASTLKEEFVRGWLNRFEPLDPVTDGAALRELANEIRGGRDL